MCALGCDWNNNDLGSAQVRGEDCGGKCLSTEGCTHFTWTSFNGGTCWMKKGSVQPGDALKTDESMVCGYRRSDPGPGPGPVKTNVLTTYHGAIEVGACRLPANSYSTNFPVALGNVQELEELKFTSSLCGHVLTVNCGKGDVDIIVTNSNLGGGLDLYASSWNKATNNLQPGVQRCSVRMTSKNIFTFDGYVCYHATGETSNDFYRNVGLLNVKNKIVTSATYEGITGRLQQSSPYFEFNGKGNRNSPVVFKFSDGSTHSIPLSQCKDGSNYKMWS
jgi:hypothetical protein